MPNAELILKPRRSDDEEVVLEAELRVAARIAERLWFRVPQRYAAGLTDAADPFVIGLAFPLMMQGLPVKVFGRVAPSLLKNLEEFMKIWEVWFPQFYRFVPIAAEEEREGPLAPASGPAVLAFSGGLDSCYSAWQHGRALAGRRTLAIAAGVFVHGFDIPLDQPDVYARALKNNAHMLASLGLEIIPVTTNFRQLSTNWRYSHGTGLASCLALLQNRFATGVIAASGSYTAVQYRWGSNFLTDHRLSSQAFAIVYDGAEVERVQKAAALARWPEALQHLRVCWEGPVKDTNCCACEKCLRTILEFRVNGLALPPCFSRDVSDRQIRGVQLQAPGVLRAFERVREAAVLAGKDREPWVKAMKVPIHRFYWRKIAGRVQKQFQDLATPMFRLAHRLTERRR